MIKIDGGEYHVSGTNLEVMMELSILFNDMLKNRHELLLATIVAYEREALTSKPCAKDFKIATMVAEETKKVISNV